MGYDIKKINCLRQTMAEYRKNLNDEKDTKKQKELQMRIKICELKIMIEKIQ